MLGILHASIIMQKHSLKVHQVPRKSEATKENYQPCLTEKCPVNLFGEDFPPSSCVHLWEGNMFLLRAFVWDTAYCAIWNRWGFVDYSIAIGKGQEVVSGCCAFLMWKHSPVPWWICLLHVHHSGNRCWGEAGKKLFLGYFL